MKALIVLMLLASSVAASGSVPVVILRQNGQSSYTFCDGPACFPQEKAQGGIWPLVAVFVVGICMVAAVWTGAKALTGKRRLIKA